MPFELANLMNGGELQAASYRLQVTVWRERDTHTQFDQSDREREKERESIRLAIKCICCKLNSSRLFTERSSFKKKPF